MRLHSEDGFASGGRFYTLQDQTLRRGPVNGTCPCQFTMIPPSGPSDVDFFFKSALQSLPMEQLQKTVLTDGDARPLPWWVHHPHLRSGPSFLVKSCKVWADIMCQEFQPSVSVLPALIVKGKSGETSDLFGGKKVAASCRYFRKPTQ